MSLVSSGDSLCKYFYRVATIRNRIALRHLNLSDGVDVKATYINKRESEGGKKEKEGEERERQTEGV